MYLSKIYIKNFRGIKELLVEFDNVCSMHGVNRIVTLRLLKRTSM